MNATTKQEIRDTISKAQWDIGEVYTELFLPASAPVNNQQMVQSGMTAVHEFKPGLKPEDGAQIVTAVVAGAGGNNKLFKAGVASLGKYGLHIHSIMTASCN